MICKIRNMNFFGDDLLAWLTLAIGGALAVGNLLALIGPASQKKSRRSRVQQYKTHQIEGGSQTEQASAQVEKIETLNEKDVSEKSSEKVSRENDNKENSAEENNGEKDNKGKLSKAPLIRSIIMIILGLVVSIWALASLLS